MEISWCSAGLVINVSFVALIRIVSLPFQATIESVSCLVGLGILNPLGTRKFLIV